MHMTLTIKRKSMVDTHTPLRSRRVECFHVRQWHLLTQQTEICKMAVLITHIHACAHTHSPLHSTPLHSRGLSYETCSYCSILDSPANGFTAANITKETVSLTDHSVIANPWAQEFHMSCMSLSHEHWTANTATHSYQGSDIPARARRMLPIQF